MIVHVISNLPSDVYDQGMRIAFYTDEELIRFGYDPDNSAGTRFPSVEAIVASEMQIDLNNGSLLGQLRDEHGYDVEVTYHGVPKDDDYERFRHVLHLIDLLESGIAKLLHTYKDEKLIEQWNTLCDFICNHCDDIEEGTPMDMAESAVAFGLAVCEASELKACHYCKTNPPEAGSSYCHTCASSKEIVTLDSYVSLGDSGCDSAFAIFKTTKGEVWGVELGPGYSPNGFNHPGWIWCNTQQFEEDERNPRAITQDQWIQNWLQGDYSEPGDAMEYLPELDNAGKDCDDPFWQSQERVVEKMKQYLIAGCL